MARDLSGWSSPGLDPMPMVTTTTGLLVVRPRLSVGSSLFVKVVAPGAVGMGLDWIGSNACWGPWSSLGMDGLG